MFIPNKIVFNIGDVSKTIIVGCPSQITKGTYYVQWSETRQKLSLDEMGFSQIQPTEMKVVDPVSNYINF